MGKNTTSRVTDWRSNQDDERTRALKCCVRSTLSGASRRDGLLSRWRDGSCDRGGAAAQRDINITLQRLAEARAEVKRLRAASQRSLPRVVEMTQRRNARAVAAYLQQTCSRRRHRCTTR